MLIEPPFAVVNPVDTLLALAEISMEEAAVMEGVAKAYGFLFFIIVVEIIVLLRSSETVASEVFVVFGKEFIRLARYGLASARYKHSTVQLVVLVWCTGSSQM